MQVGEWYVQRFANGDASYMQITKIQKNGGVTGRAYFVDPSRPRVKPKGKTQHVWAIEASRAYRGDPHALWKRIAAADVPIHTFAD